MTFDTVSMYASETWNSLIMTFVSSAFAYVIGIPLGILLIVWAKDGIRPHPRAQEVLGVAINLVRSVPFLILLIAIQSYTRLLVGTTVGVKAIRPWQALSGPAASAPSPSTTAITGMTQGPCGWPLLSS